MTDDWISVLELELTLSLSASLSVVAGECYGLIGLNGAGKSTTFKLVTGALEADSGEVALHCARLGFCPQNNSIDPHITVLHQLRVGRLTLTDRGWRREYFHF